MSLLKITLRQLILFDDASMSGERITRGVVRLGGGTYCDHMTRFDAEGLAARRKKAGMSQAELAKRIGATQQAVSLWEQGTDPQAVWLPLLADHLDCGLRDLFTRPEVSTQAAATGDLRAANA